ncbi:MAG: DUF192 domain-containing protein [Rhodocyclales bacterium]|nr:DUF192 domain-containing protein [Rhodocyclales bacterium]
MQPVDVLRIETATGFRQRLLGLMFKRPPAERGRALLLPRCRSIHTCFMRYALDIAWLDAEGRIVGCATGLAPWRMGFGPPGTRHTLELAAGTLAALGLAVGDHIEHVRFAKKGPA